jgi:type II secretory pathway pseudopilin PulG
MKTIKKYWLAIIGIIAAIAGTIFMMNNNSTKKREELDEAISDNKQQVDELEGKIEVIEEQREEVKQEIVKQEVVIETLETAKENIVVAERTVADAKENILAKTKRNRRPKK